jgi:large subunit ribosomal protein L25
MSIVLEGKIRETRGKGGARQVRREAGLPAVIYGLDGNLSLQVPSKKFHKLIKDKGKNILIDLEIEGDSKKQRKVMVKEYQTHPLEDDWLHVDFLELDMNKKITAHVPVILIGHSPGEKQGGLVNHAAHSLDIECLPGDILSSIEVDMEKVEMDQVVHVSDLTVSDKVHILNRPGDVVVSVYVDKVKVEETEEVEEEEATAVDEDTAEKADDGDKK